MFIYIDRLLINGMINLTSLNIHRFIITCILLAAKFFDDQFYFNPYFASVGGVNKYELNDLELELLFLLEFNLFVDRGEYEKYYQSLVNLAYHKGFVAFQEDLPYALPAKETVEPNVRKRFFFCNLVLF